VATSLATESSVGTSSVVGMAIGAAIAVVVGVVLANVSPSWYDRWTNGPLTPLTDLLLVLNVVGLLISAKVI
jgi:ABC-type nickel/cobalt efflux system permease component RcnA